MRATLKSSVGRLAVAASGLAALMIAAAPAVAATNLIVNPGFETGDFTGWTIGGNSDPTAFGVLCLGGALVAEGNCSAYSSAIGAPVTFSQTFATIVGQSYEVDYWALFDGASGSQFGATFGGTSLSNLNNPSGTLNFTRNNLVATSALTTLTFSLRDDPGFMFLDAVSVTAVPEPETFAMLGVGLVALGLWRRRAMK
jgi:PEP-CTERM motif